MDRRLYFALGDLLANVVTGALIGWLVCALTPPGWNMWLVMVPAMLLGMVLSIVLAIPFGMLFGAMEIMLPVMLSGMVAAMVLSMRATMIPLSSGDALREGALCGLLAIVVIWLLNTILRGAQTLPAKVPHD